MNVEEFIREINSLIPELQILAMSDIDGPTTYCWIYVDSNDDTFYGDTAASPLEAILGFLLWANLSDISPVYCTPEPPF